MFIIRLVEKQDLDKLYALALKSDSGLTTLPKHKPSLKDKIDQSIASVKNDNLKDKKGYYLFVMEEVESGKIIGTSALIAGIGLEKPFYSYRVLHQTQVSHDPEMRIDTEMLHLSNDYVGATEAATLFLDPDFRQGNLGRMLAKVRYVFLAAHPDRFADTVISEIRGWVDDNESSPFWEAIGRHFFNMDFTEADQINGQGNSQFIADMMPKFPIYTSLLPKSAQAVIGKPHEKAIAAIALLKKEGFRHAGAVDIFDGGPTMEVPKMGILTTRLTQKGILAGTVEGGRDTEKVMVANPDLQNFRAVLTNAVETDSGLWLSDSAATALELKTGEQLCFAPVTV